MRAPANRWLTTPNSSFILVGTKKQAWEKLLSHACFRLHPLVI